MKTTSLPFRRKLNGKTNYRQRMKLLLSKKPRLVVRKSLKNIIAQVVEYFPEGDKIVSSANTAELKKLDWKGSSGNVPSAYLVGLLIGKKAKEKQIEEVVLDLGLQKTIKGSRLFALTKGVIDAGIKIPHSPEIFPDEKRISGAHISDFGAKLKEDNEKFNKQFSSYVKNNVNVSDIPKNFEETKKKILGA
ncbi:50S ribosomal protein L18 [Nanoarchaeota archaeon]